MALRIMIRRIKKLDNMRECLALIESMKFKQVSMQGSMWSGNDHLIGYGRDNKTCKITRGEYDFYVVVINLADTKRIELFNNEVKRMNKMKKENL